jgi:hypothetical protein
MITQFKNFLALLLISALLYSCNTQKVSQNKIQKKDRPEPNVVLLLTDDLGWQDLKVYDIDNPSPYETPNIDAFAKEGVQFWQA